MNCSVVVASGHCVYLHGAYADNIQVMFPRYAAVVANKTDLYASPEYIQDFNADYDYGFFILNGNSNEGFGWSAIVPDKELLRCIVTNCVYPNDKDPWLQIRITRGEITKVTTNSLFYTNDTIVWESSIHVVQWLFDCSWSSQLWWLSKLCT